MNQIVVSVSNMASKDSGVPTQTVKYRQKIFQNIYFGKSIKPLGNKSYVCHYSLKVSCKYCTVLLLSATNAKDTISHCSWLNNFLIRIIVYFTHTVKFNSGFNDYIDNWLMQYCVINCAYCTSQNWVDSNCLL